MVVIMLEIKNLTKYYGNTVGVLDLSLKLNKGEVFGFIGPNGAGKSTTIKCILGLVNKTSGEINTLKKEDIGYLPSEINLYDDLTVKQMLDYNETFYKKNIKEKRKYLVNKLKLDESKKIEELSLGNLKKLGIILALVHSPKLIILDEPTSGLDPIMQEVFYELIKEEKNNGNTIFYSTHILSEINKICDRVGIIKNGKLIKITYLDEISNHNYLVTIKTKDNIKLNVEYKKDNYEYKFLYNEDINNLIKLLSRYNILKLEITEPSIEDMFLDFYR